MASSKGKIKTCDEGAAAGAIFTIFAFFDLLRFLGYN